MVPTQLDVFTPALSCRLILDRPFRTALPQTFGCRASKHLPPTCASYISRPGLQYQLTRSIRTFLAQIFFQYYLNLTFEDEFCSGTFTIDRCAS